MSNYLGRLDKETLGSEKFNTQVLKEGQRNASIPSMMFFYKKYGVYPCIIEPYFDDNAYIPYSIAMKVLQEDLAHDVKNDIVHKYFSNKNNYKYVQSQLSDLGNGIMIQFNSGSLLENLESTVKIEYAVNKLHHIFYGCKVLYTPDKEEEVEKITKLIGNVVLKPIVEASLQMICRNQHGFYLTPIKIKKPIISDLKLHYGDEFEKVHTTIIDALKQEEAHGLILLHGLPGSGKTHYIRYLIQEIKDKQLIYIPPDMTTSISTPEFFPFMLEHKDSILIIEDAENIIKSRAEKGTTTQAVANLLNLSDGLLGDSLHQPIIATFNCELHTIDPALLRKGRLISQYEFGKLSIENAQKLSDQLGYKTKITQEMTLADIYGQEKEDAKAN